MFTIILIKSLDIISEFSNKLFKLVTESNNTDKAGTLLKLNGIIVNITNCSHIFLLCKLFEI